MAPTVEILVGVGGDDFAWRPGELLDMSDEDAGKWADGERGRLVAERQTERPGGPIETTEQRPPATPGPPRETTRKPAPTRSTRTSKAGPE